MKARARVILPLALMMLMGGNSPTPGQRADVQQGLEALIARGFTYRLLDNTLIETTDPMSGNKRVKNPQAPNETYLRSWATQRGIPVLEIDPSTIDTSRYSGWYAYWTTAPLGNGPGLPLVIADLNHNGETDIYGVYLDTFWTESVSRAYEVDTLGTALFRYEYNPRPGASRQLVDADRDSLMEVVWSSGGIASGYEQRSQDSIPFSRTYQHDRYYHNSSAASPGFVLQTLDGDSLTDFLYQGTAPDPNDTNIAISKTFVAEYTPGMQAFDRVWSTQFVPGSGAAGFSVGDFDSDGSIDFVATHGQGRVFVTENTGDNQYTMVWQDSTPFVNFYYHGSGDVDHDQKTEFFAGATMSNGNWVLMYEADSNNSYSAKFLFHLMSGGIFAEPIYTTLDVDGDDLLELAMLVGADLYVFKSNADNQYTLWYLKRENAADAVTFYDFNLDGRQDLVISRFAVNSQGRGWLYADIYWASPLVNVRQENSRLAGFRLAPNYPNPFNPQTTLQYVIPKRQRVTLSIYDLLGRRIALLVDTEQEEGIHNAVWHATGMPSGVYICRLEVAGKSQTVKLLLIR